MILEEVVGFLRKTPPFQFFDETGLKGIADSLSMEFYPREMVILRQGESPSDSLRIIKKGAVKIMMKSETGEDVMIDLKGEGDNFGFLSIIGSGMQRTTVVAAEDTICYILPRDRVMKLIETSPAFSEYFISYLSRYVDRTYREMRSRSLFSGSSDRFLFTTNVGDIAKDVITVDEQTTIQEAAQVMVKQRVSSLIVLNRRSVPVGIVTDRDLREKVVAKGRSVGEPIRNIMTISLIRVEAGDSCFEALLKMLRYNIHHMLVIKDGSLKGIMTNHDLMLLQGTSPLSLMHTIESQGTVEGLVSASEKISSITGLLLKEEAKANSIAKIITEIHDRMVRKVLELAETTVGRPPLPYCFFVFGSQGRREQTFKTDQDNALVYADPASAGEEAEAQAYFLRFTAFVMESLEKIGFPLCPAQYMASNPQWCQPFSVWKRYFTNWISTPTPDAVLRSLIFFDSRPLHGKTALFESLRDHYLALLGSHANFLGHMANMITKNTPPVGFLKSFVVEKGGEHKDEFDLKVKGITPFVDAIRLFALEHRIKETATYDRLMALREKNSMIRDHAEELAHAFEFLMHLRIHNQFEEMSAGRAPDNFINPNRLSSLEKKTIREAFHMISRLQGLIGEIYKIFLR